MSPRHACVGVFMLMGALAACARDPAQVAWDEQFYAALRAPADGRVAELDRLAEDAVRVIDAGAARYEAASSLEEIAAQRGDAPLAAARRWQDIARHGTRRADRARAHYQLGRLAEARGLLVVADHIDRAIIQYYPDLMPGERSLAHVVRRARARGDAAMDAVLEWLRQDEAIVDGPLGDNALFLAADEAERRYHAGDASMGTIAESLYRRMQEQYPSSALWNDAVWARSYLLHERARYDDEIAAIRAIQRTRSAVSLFGQNEHEHYWKGQLRIARVQWKELHRPADAIATYRAYLDMFPLTIKRDDLLFYIGCAATDAGLEDDAWAGLARDFPDSKYLRRLPNPSPAQCTPPEVE